MELYKPTPKGVKVILRARENCKTIKELEDITGYKKSTIQTYLSRYEGLGEEKRKRKRNIIKELKTGKKQSKIAKEFNVSRQYVHIIKKSCFEVKND